MELTIRRAVPGDERTLAELNAFVHELHVAGHPSRFRTASLHEVTAYFGGLLSDEVATVWIAEEEGALVGYVCALLRERPEDVFSRARRWTELDQIAVRTDQHRRGIGRALVERVVEAARTDGVDDIELTCGSFNGAAAEAFRRLGFEPVTERLRLRTR